MNKTFITYKTLLTGTLFAIALSSTVFAAEGWGIKHEKETRVEVKVVDLLCEVTGNCVANCGDGKRQLGLLFDDGKLVPAVKNAEAFAGAVDDLLPFCGQRIVADGLMISNPKMPMFLLQFKRSAAPGKPKGKWSGANWFGKNWSKANGGKDSSDWFRNDTRIKEILAKDGILGIPGLKPPE
jgi:hypothetical protein